MSGIRVKGLRTARRIYAQLVRWCRVSPPNLAAGRGTQIRAVTAQVGRMNFRRTVSLASVHAGKRHVEQTGCAESR